MKAISIKAFLAGNILCFALPFAIFLALSLIAIAFRPAGIAIAQAVASPPDWFMAAIPVTGALSIVAVGYLTARIAGTAPLLNGTLATTLFMIANVVQFGMHHVSRISSLPIAIFSFGAPVLAFAGAWLRQWQITSS